MMSNRKLKALILRGLGFAVLVGSVLVANPSASARAKEHGVDGIYVGQIHLEVGDKRTMPLQIALTTTGETELSQIGPGVPEERLIIEGAFVIDNEGGPYEFAHVTYNLDLSLVDLRYNRRDATVGQVPAHFRLQGNVDLDGKISGQVLSGFQGPIGTFEVKRSTRSTLRVASKYRGVWSGMGKGIEGYPVAVEIGLDDAAQSQVNPSNYEFYYTPGKLGYLAWNGQKLKFNQISIDYLRGGVVFSDTSSVDQGQTATVEAVLDPVTGDLVGTFYGVYKGRLLTFRLKKIH